MFNQRLLLAVLAALFLGGCAQQDEAQRIVDEAIRAHGGSQFERSIIEFDFRGDQFRLYRNRGLYSYERVYEDSAGTVREVLNNDELYREVNDQRVPLSEQETRQVETAVNSVAYFAVLPYRLNDPAVQKQYLGEESVRGELYDKVEITFRPEGGGRDHEDRFVYWFHRDRRTMDYLAYDFHVNDGGTRFRKAVNTREIGGIRFADYLNYTAPAVGDRVEDYAQLLDTDALQLVSEIRLDNVRVLPLRH